MSHVAAIDIDITDLDALEEACKRLGWELVRGAKTYAWFGRWVGDYKEADAAMNHGIKPEDFGKCDHKIKVPGTKYEIGLVKRGKSFKAVFDFWDQGIKKAVGGSTCPKLKQLYGLTKPKIECLKRGYKVKEKKLKNDEIQLVVEGRF